MELDEVIRLTKQDLENVNPDKRVHTEFRFTVEQVKQLLEWLEDYKKLKADYIELDKQLRTANTENDELKRMLVIEDFRRSNRVGSNYGVVCDNSIKGGCGASTGWNHRTRWISCSERLPDKDGDFLCVINGEKQILPYRNGEFYSIYFDRILHTFLRCCNSSVSHWMPIPELPKEV